MSLVEILVATFIFIVAFGALLNSVLAAVAFINQSREQNIAIGDARNLMEKIRATAFDSLITAFPNGVQDGSSPRKYNTFLIGGYSLKNEHLTVTYASTLTDPLEIRVLTSWVGRTGRPSSIQLTTFRTRVAQ